MKGNETFKVAVKAMADVSSELLSEQGFTHEQIDLFIPHQANLRIIDAVGEGSRSTREKVYKNVERYGNTSAASIPIALEECVREGRREVGRHGPADGVRRQGSLLGLGAPALVRRKLRLAHRLNP